MTVIMHGPQKVASLDPILSRWWRTVDVWTMVCVIMLFILGSILMLASSPPLAQSNGLSNPFHYAERQGIFGILSLITMIVISIMSPVTVRRLAAIGFIVAVIGLILLPIFGTSHGKGAIRWYSLGFTSLQPSEFLKPMFVVFAAWLLSAAFQADGLPGRRISFFLTTAIAVILALQPDYGQASLIVFAWLTMYFVAGAPFFVLLILACVIIFSGIFAYHNSAHVAGRIDGFLQADLGSNTQLSYVSNAILEGGFFGVGTGEGTVKWSLPDAHTDFIIAVAAEEYGMVMVLLIIGLYAMIVLRSLGRLLQERDLFVRLAGTGLIAIFSAQAMINMGVAVRLLPAKGMTLPLISYGGSSMLAIGVSLGMILCFTRHRTQGTLGNVMRDYS